MAENVPQEIDTSWTCDGEVDPPVADTGPSPTTNTNSTNVLKDIGNQLNETIEGPSAEHIANQRKPSISSFLKCPSTPKRAKTHRQFKRPFYPVLTAGERLDELHRIEREKENAIVEKKAKAERRAKAKLEAEELKAAIKERKREEALLRKTARENLRKDGLGSRKQIRSKK